MIDEPEIFKVAAALSAEERASYLDAACADQPGARERVEELLRHHDAAGFMDVEAIASLSPEVEAELARLKPEAAGDRLGHYTLLEQIGEGGFGTVWVADQDLPVRRRVALKIIKLGMDTREVVARFEQERQALALMDHPNIARVLDAGATPTGRPFFVMELVRGIKITDYCDQANLPTAERLELFVAVCNAVQHAHQKGIIHRDLKPSNILVTLHDGVPVPKVIDFGVAKATQQQRLSDLTIYTQFEQMIGTPLYMSPEQAEMSGLDIDTRSDIYSLGVLLYELLTGRTPFDPKELMQAGFDEMRRVIREKEPQKPSTALQTMAAEVRTSVAQRRRVDGTKIAGLLRGDLDWIVMKALEKDRTRRYETANGFAEDIRRHLANEPVSAAAPSVAYLLSKFARRNKVAIGVSALFVAVLLAATGVSLWQTKLAVIAKNDASAKAIAEHAAREESDAIAKYLTEVFESPDWSKDGHKITVAETLDRAGKKLEVDLAGQPARRAKLEGTFGATYYALGLPREAIPYQERALNYLKSVHGPEHENTLAAMENLAASLTSTDRRAEALKLTDEVLEVRRKVLGPEHPKTLEAMHTLAHIYSQGYRDKEALELLLEVVRLRRNVLGPEHRDTLLSMHNLASSYHAIEKNEEALELREKVLPLFRKTLGSEHPSTLAAIGGLASSLSEIGRWDDALKLWEEAQPICRKVLGPEHPGTILGMINLANGYRGVGRREEALQQEEEALPLARKASGPEHPNTILAVSRLADTYGEEGRIEEALALWAEASPFHPEDTSLAEKVAILQAWFRMDAAHAATCRRVLTRADGTGKASTAHRAARSYCVLPSTDPELLDAALKLARRAVELGKDDKSMFHLQMVLGMAEYRHGDDEAAAVALRAAEQTSGYDRSVYPTACFFRAMSLFRQGKQSEAGVLFAKGTTRMNMPPADERRPLLGGAGASDVVVWLAYNEARAKLPAEVQTQGKAALVKLRQQAFAETQEKYGAEHRETLSAERKLADALCTAGRAEESIPLLMDISSRNPTDTILSLKVAALQVWFGRTADHLATCIRLIEIAEKPSDDGQAAERAAKAWCMQGASDPKLIERTLALARRAGDQVPKKWKRAWFQQTLGMAEYRAGNLEAAEQALIAAEKFAGATTTGETRLRPLIEGPAQLYRAMMQFRSGNIASAQKLFAQAEARMRPLPGNAGEVLANGASQDELIFWLTYKEAKAMLQRGAEAGKPDAGK